MNEATSSLLNLSSSIPSTQQSDSLISIYSNYETYNSSDYSFSDEQKDVISNLLKLQDEASSCVGNLLYNTMEVMRCLKLKTDFRAEPKFISLQTTGKFTKNEGIDMFLAIVHDVNIMEIKKHVKTNLRAILNAFKSFPFMDMIKQAKYISSYWVFELTDERLLYINSSHPSSHDIIVPELYYHSKCETILYLDLPSMIICEFDITLNVPPLDVLDIKLEYAMVVHNDLNGIGTVVLSMFNSFPINDVYICSFSHITNQFVKELQKYNHVIVVDLDFKEYTTSNMTVIRHKTRNDEALDLELNQYMSMKYSKKKSSRRYKRLKGSYGAGVDQMKMDVSISEHCGAYSFYHRFIPIDKHTPAQDRFVQLIDIYSNWNTSHIDFKQAQALNFIFLRYVRNITRIVRLNLRNVSHTIGKSIIFPFYFEMFYNLSHESFLFTQHQLKEYNSMKEEVRCFISKISSAPIKNIKSDGRGHTYFTFIGRSDIDNDAIAHHLLNKEGISITYVVIKWQILLSPRSMVSMRSQSFNLLSIPGFHGYATRGSIKWRDLQRYFDNSNLDIE